MDEGNSILTKKRLRQSARPGTITYVSQRRFVIAGYRTIVCGERKMNLLARNCADERVSEAASQKRQTALCRTAAWPKGSHCGVPHEKVGKPRGTRMRP